MKYIYFLGCVIFFLGACSHSNVHPEIENILPPIPDASYKRLIKKHSQSDKQYQGFYNTYEVHATILNTKVKTAILQRNGHFMQWEASKARSEREKTFQELSSVGHFFISFYSPKNDHDDLSLGTSMWKVYLESNGVRYTANVKKKKMKLSQLKDLYPFHTRFSTAYVVEFKVPMTAIEVSSSKLTLTSSLGTTEFSFHPIK